MPPTEMQLRYFKCLTQIVKSNYYQKLYDDRKHVEIMFHYLKNLKLALLKSAGNKSPNM